MEKNKKYHIELEVITPLCVGAGNDNDWVKGLDYVQKDGKVYVLDMQRMVEEGVDMDRLSLLFEKMNNEGVVRLLGNKLPLVAKRIYGSPPIATENAIKTFLRTGLYDRPLVAGSSLKGAIRSALFHKYRKKIDEKPISDSRQEDTDVFGNIQNNFMKLIQVGDIELTETQLVNTKVFNLHSSNHVDWLGGWKHAKENNTSNNFAPIGFNTLYECALTGERGVGTLVLAALPKGVSPKTAIRPCDEPKRKALWEGGIEKLFSIINDATRDYLRKERVFFDMFPAERSEEVIECIDLLLDQIPSNGSYCVLKMSAGTGFHSITGDWRFENYTDLAYNPFRNRNGKEFRYKSRKIADTDGGLKLMGFVKLYAVGEDEVQRDREQWLTWKKKKEQERVEEVRKIQMEETKREAERLKQEQYHELIEKAKDLYAHNQFNEALKTLQQAEDKMPEGAEHANLMKQCEEKSNKEKANNEILQKQADATAQRFAGSLAEALKGKSSSYGSIAGTLEKWLKAGEGRIIGEPELAALANALQELPNKEKRDEKKKSGKLKRLLGDDLSSKLFE